MTQLAQSSIPAILCEKMIVNPHLNIVSYSEDEILVKHGSRSSFSRIIRDDGRTKLLMRVMRSFQVTCSGEELMDADRMRESERENLATLLQYLQREHVLVDPSEDPTQAYLDTMLSATSSLSEYAVGLAGVGYLGARIAVELAQFRVKEIVALDHRVCLNPAQDRHYFHGMNGSLKVDRPYTDLLRESLAQSNYDQLRVVKGGITDDDSIVELFATADVVVVALEEYSPYILHKINKIALEARKPWLSVMIDGSEAHVGPLFIPGETCCYNEVDLQQIASALDIKDDYVSYRETVEERASRVSPPILSPYLSVASGMAVTGLMRFLATHTSFLIERSVRIDFERLSIDHETVMRLPRCPACSVTKPYRHLFL